MIPENDTVCDWKPCELVNPFFKGGKITRSESSTFSFLRDGNICTIELDATTFKDKQIKREEITHGEEVVCFCVSSNGTMLATVSNGYLLKHWNMPEKECKKIIKIHKSPVICMEFDCTSTLVAIGFADGAIRVWDIVRGYCTHTFKSHNDLVRILHFRQNSTTMQIFSGCDDGSIKCFDLLTSKCVAEFRNHVGSPTSFSSCSDCTEVLVSVGRDKVDD